MYSVVNFTRCERRVLSVRIGHLEKGLKPNKDQLGSFEQPYKRSHMVHLTTNCFSLRDFVRKADTNNNVPRRLGKFFWCTSPILGTQIFLGFTLTHLLLNYDTSKVRVEYKAIGTVNGKNTYFYFSLIFEAVTML